MKLTLKRKEFLKDRTLGELYINDVYFCDTLEDTDRGMHFDYPLEEIKAIKQYGITAIPYGIYKVVMTYSPKFKQVLPLLLNVPAYGGIRIHSGNTPEHSLGCILVGKRYGDVVVNSKATLQKFLPLLTKASKSEEITIQIQ